MKATGLAVDPRARVTARQTMLRNIRDIESRQGEPVDQLVAQRKAHLSRSATGEIEDIFLVPEIRDWLSLLKQAEIDSLHFSEQERSPLGLVVNDNSLMFHVLQQERTAKDEVVTRPDFGEQIGKLSFQVKDTKDNEWLRVGVYFAANRWNEDSVYCSELHAPDYVILVPEAAYTNKRDAQAYSLANLDSEQAEAIYQEIEPTVRKYYLDPVRN